jgi:hypothetical protein
MIELAAAALSQGWRSRTRHPRRPPRSLVTQTGPVC